MWTQNYISPYKNTLSFVYQKPLIRTFTQFFKYLCEFTTPEHKSKRGFCTQELVSNGLSKDFWYTKINLSKISILLRCDAVLKFCIKKRYLDLTHYVVL